LTKLSKRLASLDDSIGDLKNIWIGGWGRNDYNHYRNPMKPGEDIQVTEEYFYDLIKRVHKIDLDVLNKEINIYLEPYYEFQQKLITELSIIREKEQFSNEIELLGTLEQFKWGVTMADYIGISRPKNIPIYDIRILSRGLDTPPHIIVFGFLISLITKAGSVNDFEKLAFRLLKQVELKINIPAFAENTGNADRILSNIFDNFHKFSSQLKNRHNNRGTIEIVDEYDVQDLLHAILKLHFNDIREEEYTPSYGGASSRVDFLLKEHKIVIEVKKTRDRLSDKEIGDQLILDIARYKNHPHCNYLKCFVYDPENRIKNPRGLEAISGV
jgi:hypothetical protein